MPFTLPDSLPTARQDLTDLRTQAADAFAEYKKIVEAGDTPTAEQVAEMRGLVDAIDQIDNAITETDEAEALAEEARELADKVTEPKPEPEAEADADDTTGEADTETAEAAETEDEKVPAMAASGRTDFSGIGHTPDVPDDTKTVGFRLDPSIPDYTPGLVGFRRFAESVDQVRAGTMAIRQGARPSAGGFLSQTFARLDRPGTPVHDGQELLAAIGQATDEKNLDGGSLTAAGGWCAPSETIYDFCEVPEASNLLSLPEITIGRGGIRFPKEPDLSDVDGFYFTEPELEAETDGKPDAVKECAEVPCPDFDEIRLEAVGLCVKAGILQNDGWPEVVENFLKQFMQKHLRGISKKSITKMVDGSDSKTISTDDVMAAGASVLNSLALLAANLRIKRGLPYSATIEGVAPAWLLELIRADVANQGGINQLAVTDAQITDWLSARNIALQFVGDWQTGSSGKPGNLDTLAYPSTVDVLLYPAGTWFRSLRNVIEVGNQYPMEQLQVNRYTRFFTEDAFAVGKRCADSLVVTIPVCPSGQIGQRGYLDCNAPVAP